MTRRALLQAASSLAAFAQAPVSRLSGSRVRIALNCFSFDRPLRDGSMTLPEVVRFCARHGIDGLDATGYYFPGYPQAPDADYVRNLKREAFVNGVTIMGTGVRNDFTLPDPAARRESVDLVKRWIETAAGLGASVIRVFSGAGVPAGHTFDEVLAWMTPAFAECVEHGRKYGVIVGLQNHDDFVKTAGDTIRVLRAVNSEWFGLILDVGSLRQRELYGEIEKLVPYAVSWQLKENVDLRKLKAIIDAAGYCGFLPIETLGPGDPAAKVTKFLAEVRAVFAA